MDASILHLTAVTPALPLKGREILTQLKMRTNQNVAAGMPLLRTLTSGSGRKQKPPVRKL